MKVSQPDTRHLHERPRPRDGGRGDLRCGPAPQRPCRSASTPSAARHLTPCDSRPNHSLRRRPKCPPQLPRRLSSSTDRPVPGRTTSDLVLHITPVRCGRNGSLRAMRSLIGVPSKTRYLCPPTALPASPPDLRNLRHVRRSDSCALAGQRRRRSELLGRCAGLRRLPSYFAGGIFWLKRNTLSGSYRFLISRNRVNFSSPYAARTRSVGSSADM